MYRKERKRKISGIISACLLNAPINNIYVILVARAQFTRHADEDDNIRRIVDCNKIPSNRITVDFWFIFRD